MMPSPRDTYSGIFPRLSTYAEQRGKQASQRLEVCWKRFGVLQASLRFVHNRYEFDHLRMHNRFLIYRCTFGNRKNRKVLFPTRHLDWNTNIRTNWLVKGYNLKRNPEKSNWSVMLCTSSFVLLPYVGSRNNREIWMVNGDMICFKNIMP